MLKDLFASILIIILISLALATKIYLGFEV